MASRIYRKVQQEFPKVSVEIVVDLTPNLQEGYVLGTWTWPFTRANVGF